jgi:predicted RNase H-like HicB family nuclease
MPDIPGVMADGATEMEAIADGREAFIATVSAMVDSYGNMATRKRVREWVGG